MAASNIPFDWVEFGNHPAVSEGEEKRCGGLWQPPLANNIPFTGQRLSFEKLSSPDFHEWARGQQYDLAIQGGVGILKPEVMALFKAGILNLHPGRVPHYRGCSAPEWQLAEQEPIMTTAHIIDAGIDTGPVFCEFELKVKTDTYEAFRGSIYPEVALGLSRILHHLQSLSVDEFTQQLTEQDTHVGQYRNYYGDDAIENLKMQFPHIAQYLKSSKN